MKGQVDQNNRRGIPSGALHSMLSTDSRPGGLRLWYVAPERFASEQFAPLVGELHAKLQRMISYADADPPSHHVLAPVVLLPSPHAPPPRPYRTGRK